MTQEEFREKVLALTETEKRLKAGTYSPLEFSKQALINAKKDQNGYYYFTNHKMSVSPHNYELRLPITYSSQGNFLRLLIHTRFTEIPFHYDEFISVQYVYSGKMHLNFPDTEMTLTTGQLILMNSDIVHSFRMETEHDIVFSIQIQREYMQKELLYGISGEGAVADFLLKSILGEKSDFTYAFFDFNNDVRMQFLFEELFCEYLEPSICGNALVQDYMRIFFILLIRASNSRIINSRDRQIVEMLQFIEENSRHCTLHDLAAKFNFNPKYISALLKEKTGRSFTELLASAKMKTICFLLKNTDKSIREIAEMCGYTNQTYFYQKFKEMYGVNPKEYRMDILKK